MIEKHIDYINRIGGGDLALIKKDIEKLYNLKINSTTIITQGYEDLNLKLTTNECSYFVKIFNKNRTKQECEEIIDRFVSVCETGVMCPEILKPIKGDRLLSQTKQGKRNIYYLVMEFIEGKDYLKINRTLTKKEMLQLIKSSQKLSLLNKHYYIYNAWEVNNFAKEYEANLYLLKDDIKNELNSIYEKFKKLDMESLPKSFIHGDINAGNTILNTTNKLVLVDFCSANYTSRINEILTMCASGLIVDENSSKTIKNIRSAFKIWCREMKATKVEKQNFYFLYQVQTALNYLQAYIENEKGNSTEENKRNLKEDYFALKLASKLVK